MVKMNEKAIFEISDMIHVKYGHPYKFIIFGGTELTAEQITQTYEYKKFKEVYPELCRLAEEK